MPFSIRDAATCNAVRELAKLRDVSLTDAIRGAVEKALAKEVAGQTSVQTDDKISGKEE